MAIQDVKNLFSENAKTEFTKYLKENDLVSFHEYCKNVKKSCEQNDGNLEDAQFIIEDYFNQIGLCF
jgi:hypothetical protein